MEFRLIPGVQSVPRRAEMGIAIERLRRWTTWSANSSAKKSANSSRQGWQAGGNNSFSSGVLARRSVAMICVHAARGKSTRSAAGRIEARLDIGTDVHPGLHHRAILNRAAKGAALLWDGTANLDEPAACCVSTMLIG